MIEQADRVDAAAENWSRGATGEQTVGAQLELLRPYGFEVLHDVRWPGRRRANIDHVAIGPPGILVVDAKNWSGSVRICDGILQQNGHRRTREVEAARQAGHDVGSQLPLPWGLHTIPVIALAGAGISGVERCHDVTVLDHRDLVPWARALPRESSPQSSGVDGHGGKWPRERR
ncbi:MAG: NERD domain-containing protein [Spirochaetaceae bacterium]|nr:NERD domain-containing protein [Spirochaetaceae bacterium]